jgi:hypothetical protein
MNMSSLNEVATTVETKVPPPFEVVVGSEIFWQCFPIIQPIGVDEIVADIRRWKPGQPGPRLAAAVRFTSHELKFELQDGFSDLRAQIGGLVQQLEEAAERLEAQG